MSPVVEETEAIKLLSSKIDKLSEVLLQDVQVPKPDLNLIDVSKLSLGNDIEYPDFIKKDDKEIEFFKATFPEKEWWEEDRFFIGYVLLVALSAFVVYECFGILSSIQVQSGQPLSGQLPRGFLLFFSGVVALLFAGLVIVALCMIKSQAKQRAEKNERENKMLAFRLKMLETAFGLKNMKSLIEKQCVEKSISLKEKEFLYYLDEKQKAEDNKRKMLPHYYEILDKYMQHVAKLKEKKDEPKNLESQNTNPLEGATGVTVGQQSLPETPKHEEAPSVPKENK